MSELLECPNCGAIWGAEEIDWQQCDYCGYPDNNEDTEHDINGLIRQQEEEQEAFEREVYG